MGIVQRSIHVVPNEDGVKIGVAKKIAESDIKSLTANPQGIDVLICSARTDKIAWTYCDLIQQAQGMYSVFLKRKEPNQGRAKKDDMLCRQILVCSRVLSGK